MNLAVGEHEALLKAQSHVWHILFNFINSMSLKCAIQLGIPDIVHKHGSPMTLSELVDALPIHPAKAPCIYRLMRFLVHSGFFKQQNLAHKSGQDMEEEGFVLTNASQLILKENPLGVTPFFLAMLDPMLTEPWQHLHLWFQSDDPTPFSTVHGSTFWDLCGREPSLNNFFNEAMASDTRLASCVLIDKHKGIFQGLTSLVDVGGGTGTMAKALAKAYPELSCTVLDLPHVVADLEDGRNLKFVGGDMFEAVPPADAIMMKWILHDWSDKDCLKILKNCKEAIECREGGKVIVIDMVVKDGKGDSDNQHPIETQLSFDMLMMTLTSGLERTEKEWAKLFEDAGYSGYKISPILGLRSLIEVFPWVNLHSINVLDKKLCHLPVEVWTRKSFFGEINGDVAL